MNRKQRALTICALIAFVLIGVSHYWKWPTFALHEETRVPVSCGLANGSRRANAVVHARRNLRRLVLRTGRPEGEETMNTGRKLLTLIALRLKENRRRCSMVIRAISASFSDGRRPGAEKSLTITLGSR